MAGRLRRAAAAVGLHVARRRNWHLVRRDYYSPIPDETQLPPGAGEQRSAMAGIAFDTAAQIDWAERELGPFTGELEEGGGFSFDNQMYSYGDAEIAYAVVRRFKPRKVVELGSGHSTRVLAQALAANEADGRPGALESNDPFPAPDLPAVRRRPAQEVSAAELADVDLLFVDTTHVVKLCGDVNHIVLDLLPALREGALVHFHDIWLPYEYPSVFREVFGVHWTEQYLLQAYLSANPLWEVLFATHAVAVDQTDRFTRLVPGYSEDCYPSGFWLRRLPAV